jgi:hypothetical protein
MADLSLDELDGRFADALTQERDGFWTAADIVAFAVRDIRSPKERGKLFTHFASIGHCTTAWTRTLAALSAAYGTESRLPDVSRALYRACLLAAKRTERKAADVLADALKEGWHCKEVARLGTPTQRQFTLSKDCEACGATVTVRTQAVRGFRGLTLRCPVCLAMAAADGRAVHEAEPLGVLGAAA